MTRAEAKEKAMIVFKELSIEYEKIEEEAKKNGTWRPGLDANKRLFAKADVEAKKKLKEIEDQIDE